VILIASFATIYLFGLIFYIYVNADSKTLATLKDSLSTTSGFFSGIATLVAAYIASKLFNDWKEEKNFDAKKEYAQSILIGIRDVIIQRTIILNNNTEISATSNSLIIKTNLLNYKELRILPLIHNLYINFEAISNLTNPNYG